MRLTIHQGTQTRTLACEGGVTLQQALTEAGILLPHPCGGRGVCGKCAVQLTGAVSAPNEHEIRAGVRLSCQAVLQGDAEAILPVMQDMTVENAADAAVERPDPLGQGVGAAIDIGTTTLAMRLYDLQSGACIAAAGMLNPQTAVSADVIGRIGAAMKGQGAALQEQLTGALRALLGSAAQEVSALVVTGNTTMLYLLTGRDPTALSHAPFQADHLFGETVSLLSARAYLPPCLHAFVGADIACAVLHSGMCDHDQTALLCDVGTNGELALWKDGTLYVTSTAAGPAFEGAGIRCGCSSVPGAIDRVERSEGGLRIHTIGDQPAVGLCGSGLIDVIAALLDMEIIDETGAMEEDYFLTGQVMLTPGDVRAVQLSKAAIAAGIRCLTEAAGCREEEITRVYLAGGFGSRMNVRSAMRIGLLPQALEDRIQVIGNASLAGAAELLLDRGRIARAQRIAASAYHVDLGGNPRFNALYMDAMMFES